MMGAPHPDLATLREALAASQAQAEALRVAADKVTRHVARARKAREVYGDEGDRWPAQVASAEAALTDACGEAFAALASTPVLALATVRQAARAEALREAADKGERAFNVTPLRREIWDWLRGLAEAEAGK